MSQVLALASEFIERMSNPAHGIIDNEDYAMRFGALLKSEGFEKMLGHEVALMRDPDSLSPHGWLWLLGWARSKAIVLDETLLMRLSERLSSVFMQVSVIDVATRSSKWKPQENEVPIEEFQHQWLSRLMLKCTTLQDKERKPDDYIDTRRAEVILVAMMQVGSDVTLDAARSLLRHRWAGHNVLVRFFWSLCDELDEETKKTWVSRLNPPMQQSDDFSHG